MLITGGEYNEKLLQQTVLSLDFRKRHFRKTIQEFHGTASNRNCRTHHRNNQKTKVGLLYRQQARPYPSY